MTKWMHSIAFKLFAVTFTVIMLLLGGVLMILAGSFSSFYERTQIRNITEDIGRLRDRYARDAASGSLRKAIPLYFYDFENKYYALTSILSFDDRRFRIAVGGGFDGQEEEEGFGGGLPALPSLPKLLRSPAPVVQLQKLMSAMSEWRSDAEAVEQVMKGGETLVFRTEGSGGAESGAKQLVAITRIEGDEEGNGTVLFAVSSLQPVSNAASVIREFSYYVFGVAILLALVLAFLYARIVTKPLRSLNGAARRLAKLDFTTALALRRKDELGELGRTLNFLADNLRRTLAELQDANEELKKDIEREKRLERMRRDFIAGVSHELKTPLSLIGGYAEGLKDNIGSGAKREHYAEVILDETRRMSAIVADMLDLSHLESGRYVLKLDDFDLAALLRESAERAESMGKTKSIGVVVKPDFGQERPLYVRGDRMRIGQVLTNLLSNAVRHSPEGGVVEIAVRVSGDEADITVYNEGEPIPEEELPRIWRQFYRTDKSRSREAGGSGIGLSIVREILQLHGSRYEACNVTGGVAFSFSIGLAPSSVRE